MPINCYTGLMGSGKSYEVVSTVILDALSKGRRIVSNIDGLNYELMCDYLVANRGISREQIGSLVPVSNEQVKSLKFFCYGTMVETIVHPGDLVCIDEAWRFWGAGESISEPHFIFFREHRHYVHPDTGVCCDLVLMVQDITDLNRKLKSVVELTFRTKKHKALGLSTRYVVVVHEGYRINTKTLVNRLQKKYDPDIFPLYSSYSGGSGKEVVIDKRQNMLLSKRALIPVFLSFFVGIWSLSRVWSFFHPEVAKTSDAKAGEVVHASAPTTVQPAAAASSPDHSGSDAVRLLGFYSRSDGEFIVVYSDDGGIRAARAGAFTFDGYHTTGFIEGRPAAFLGAAP